MKDIIDDYGNPDKVLEELEQSYHVDDPELQELYDEAYDHFHAYCMLMSLEDQISTHNAGYELERCKQLLNKAKQSKQLRDKTPRGYLEPGDGDE